MALVRFGEVGRLEYNGYRFNGTNRTKSVKITPVYDRGRRTVVYNQWDITFVSYVESLSTAVKTDLVIQDIINRLNKPGGTFYFEGRGIGQQTVNLGPSGVRDVKYGPTPKVLEIEPHTGRVAKLTWSINFCVPNCIYARYTLVPLELSYTVNHEVHDDGCTTRTISGQLVIPITRRAVGDRLPVDSADLYREQITPKKLKGFARRFMPWSLSDDRTTLSFGFVDAEVGKNQLPKGVVEGTWGHSVNSTSVGLMNWQSTISVKYRMKKNATGFEGVKAFWEEVAKRLTTTRDGLKKLPDKSEIIPTGFNMNEVDAYGRTTVVNCSLSYTYIAKLKDLIGVSGLFQPIGPKWEEWSTSLDDGPHNPYGSAKLYFKQEDDYIVDACDPLLKLVPHTDGANSNSKSDGGELQIEGELRNTGDEDKKFEGELRTGPSTADKYVAEKMAKTFQKPTPDKSWIYYKNEFFIEVDNGLVPIKTLPMTPISLAETILSGVRTDIAGLPWDGLIPTLPPLTGSGSIVGTSPGSSFSGSVLPPFLQPVSGSLQSGAVAAGAAAAAATAAASKALRRVPGAIFIYMTGCAVRSNYRITPPRITKLNDVVPEPANRLDRGEGYSVGIVANGVHPLFVSRWNLRYYLPKEPTGEIPLPPNPILGSGDASDGGAAATSGAGGSLGIIRPPSTGNEPPPPVIW